MSKKNSKPSNKKSKMKYILGTGAILVSTTLLPKVLKKTTNYLYKKQLKINNRQHYSVSWEDELVKKTEYKKDQSYAD